MRVFRTLALGASVLALAVERLLDGWGQQQADRQDRLGRLR